MSIKLVSFKLCPFVQRAVIALEEKGVGYELAYIDLEDPPDWFRRRSPLGKVPLMLVDDNAVFESAVILEYLDEVYSPSLHPRDPLQRARHRGWMEYASGLLMKQHSLGMAADEESYRIQLQELKDLLIGLSVPLDEGLFGDECPYSLVDVAVTPFFMRLEIQAAIRGEIKASLPENVAKWSRYLLARPSMAASVVEDFSPRYLEFMRNKGSWLAQQSID